MIQTRNLDKTRILTTSKKRNLPSISKLEKIKVQKCQILRFREEEDCSKSQNAWDKSLKKQRVLTNLQNRSNNREVAIYENTM